MGSKNKLTSPGTQGYGQITAYMQKVRIYTKADIIAQLVKMGKDASAALATAGVMLSPRETSDRGDKTGRGNRACPWGHEAYNRLLKRKVVDGVKEDQRYQFSYRKVSMTPLRDEKRESTPQKKVAKKGTKAKAKTGTKVAAKKRAKKAAKKKK